MKRNAGVTLVELATTMSVAFVLLTTGVPSFSQMVLNNRMATEANDFVATLALARSEAQKRRLATVVRRCTSPSECASGTSWEGGWTMFVDADSDRAQDAGEPVLSVSEGFADDNTLTATANFSEFIAFLPNGLSRGNGGTSGGVFQIDDTRGVDCARKISISTIGRASVLPPDPDLCP